MISAISPVQINSREYKPSFKGVHCNIYLNHCFDSFEFSDCIKFYKKIFNFAPKSSEALDVYKGPKILEAGFSTENLEDVGGGFLQADCCTPLSTTGVRTCAVLNLVDEVTSKHILYHVFDETNARKIEEFIRKMIPNFGRANIVGGDQYQTINTMRKIIQAIDNVNPYADKCFYHTVSENPEIIAYCGDMYYMKGVKGNVSFVQKDNYWY